MANKRSKNKSELKMPDVKNPFQALFDLNLQLFKNIQFPPIEELYNLNKPNQGLERQLRFAFENSHKLINYMKQSLEILGTMQFFTSDAFMQTLESKPNLKAPLEKPRTKLTTSLTDLAMLPPFMGMTAPFVKLALNLAYPIIESTAIEEIYPLNIITKTAGPLFSLSDLTINEKENRPQGSPMRAKTLSKSKKRSSKPRDF